MLAHAASAQGISAVENMCGREHVLDHSTVPAACFTHPEVSSLILCYHYACACMYACNVTQNMLRVNGVHVMSGGVACRHTLCQGKHSCYCTLYKERLLDKRVPQKNRTRRCHIQS